MNRCRRIIPSVGLAFVLIALVATSRANDLKNAEPLPAPAPSAAVPAVPVPTEGDCCPCIEYRHHGRPICCCDCNAPPEIKMVLLVKDPQSCCGDCVAVPISLPGCCTGEPCVSSRCGILGRGIVRYDYRCGVRVTVTFRARGDIVVTYLHA